MTIETTNVTPPCSHGMLTWDGGDDSPYTCAKCHHMFFPAKPPNNASCSLCLILTEQRDRAWQHLHDLYFDQEVERRLGRSRWWWPFGRTREPDHRFVDSICIFCEYDVRKDECLKKPFVMPPCLPRSPHIWRKSLDEAEQRIAVYQSDVDGLRTDLDGALRKVEELDNSLELARLQRRRAMYACDTAADLMRKLDLMEDTDREQGELRAQLSDLKLYVIPEDKL